MISIEENVQAVGLFLFGLGDQKENSTVVLGDSTSPLTIAATKRLLGTQSVDFLFIDGNHTYKAVKSDFIHYSPFVRSGGIVGFHDTKRWSGPSRVVDEFKSEGSTEILEIHHKEIIDHRDTAMPTPHWHQKGGPGISYYIVP